jgi:hypothetical protein
MYIYITTPVLLVIFFTSPLTQLLNKDNGFLMVHRAIYLHLLLLSWKLLMH